MRSDTTIDTQRGHATEAILFGLQPMGDPRTAAEALHELQLLAETADFVVAGDLISEVALAIEMGADEVDIGKTIHPHPTLGESIGMAAEVAHGSCTDIPPQRK